MTGLSSWYSLTTMPPEQDVTLLYTQIWMDTFLLSKEGAAYPPPHPVSQMKVLSSAAPDRMFHECCDLSPWGNLKV
jgi:hypothetical protein